MYEELYHMSPILVYTGMCRSRCVFLAIFATQYTIFMFNKDNTEHVTQVKQGHNGVFGVFLWQRSMMVINKQFGYFSFIVLLING